MIERLIHNRRWRSLTFKIDEFWQAITHQIVAFIEYSIIDSVPIEVCEFARANPSKIYRDTVEYSLNHGCCVVQKTRYFGCKLYVAHMVDGVFKFLILLKMSYKIFVFEMVLKRSFQAVF